MNQFSPEPPGSATPAVNEKIVDIEIFSYFVEMLFGSCLDSYNGLLTNVQCCKCFITSVSNTNDKLLLMSLLPVINYR